MGGDTCAALLPQAHIPSAQPEDNIVDKSTLLRQANDFMIRAVTAERKQHV